ncbi:phage baseplate assembly protein V [Pedobacter sp. MC2016-15]|uniref:type VI secretion system Vgr family protein n=1 Tax=Pedobacter sp. MC2016-15 TaxID=2994473 RepID=UPI0022462A60|nr:phage baseplate assembly protein V [Pedobacter sp. MC2016-15]MCX2478068.1 phage baseplate assembly protein V [Pedobacter sp. MC2016-15]
MSSRKLITDITVGTRKIPKIISFRLEQQFNAHHYFELEFDHDYLGKSYMIQLDDSRGLIGKTLTASFGYATGQQQKFVGVVTDIEVSQNQHSYVGITLKGYSPTLLLDSGPAMGSYLNKSLAEMVKLATAGVPGNDFSIAINPERSKPVAYMIQYRESDFEFLNRLSADYYEWFYYDGQNLNFGKPNKQKEIDITQGDDLQLLQYGMHLTPVKNSSFSYNSRQDETLRNQGSAVSPGMPDQAYALKAAGSVFGKSYAYPSAIRIDNNSEMKDLVDNEQKANISQLLKIRGRGDNPGLSIGSIADVKMKVKNDKGFTLENLGKFLITSIVHLIDDKGLYHHRFEGLVASTERLPFKDVLRPVPELQLADVIDNADPLKQGRVKLKFKWPYGHNDPTDWLRVSTPDAGSSSNVVQNRGFVFVPESGDQVVVGFEEGNITRPVVMGSVFHGKNGIGGQQNNDQKSLTSRSGHILSLHDSAGITLMDHTRQNHIAIDGKDAVTMTADQTITLQTGSVKIVMDKKLDKITIQAKHIEILASDDFKLRGHSSGAPAKNGSLEFDEKLSISARKDLTLHGQSALDLTGDTVSMRGTETNIEGSQVKINS